MAKFLDKPRNFAIFGAFSRTLVCFNLILYKVSSQQQVMHTYYFIDINLNDLISARNYEDDRNCVLFTLPENKPEICRMLRDDE
jgi:hypothetical protein